MTFRSTHRPTPLFTFGTLARSGSHIGRGLAACGLAASLVFSLACAEGTGTASEPTPEEPEGEPEGVPAELGWEQILDADATLQNRWGFVSVDIGAGKSLVFGGANLGDFEGEVLGDAMIIDANENPPAITTLSVPADLSPRYCGCGAFDASRNEVILVGGRSTDDLYIETFVFDIDAETFTKVEAPGPTAVIGCAATYVAGDDTTYMFGGGAEEGGLLDEMWAWDGDARAWSADTYAAGAAPIRRYDGAMREVVPGGPLYLFGGFGDGAYLNDLWTFDTETSTWTEIAAEGPGGRRVPWMVTEPSGEGFYVAFGTYGFQPDEAFADLWRFDIAASAWEELTLEEGPSLRGFSQWLPGGDGEIGMVLGGYDGANPIAEMWRLHAPETGGF